MLHAATGGSSPDRSWSQKTHGSVSSSPRFMLASKVCQRCPSSVPRWAAERGCTLKSTVKTSQQRPPRGFAQIDSDSSRSCQKTVHSLNSADLSDGFTCQHYSATPSGSRLSCGRYRLHPRNVDPAVGAVAIEMQPVKRTLSRPLFGSPSSVSVNYLHWCPPSLPRHATPQANSDGLLNLLTLVSNE